MTRRRKVQIASVIVGLYVVVAYLALPVLLKREDKAVPAARFPKTAETAYGKQGDALNVALVGTREDVIRAMQAAGWYPADPVTLRSSAGIVKSVLLDRPDDEAPVSALYLYGRKQDLAFEKPAAKSAKERHHVRFWLQGPSEDGRNQWIGGATFDQSVGLSHETGQVTHHIGPDIDAERDMLIDDLMKAEWIVSTKRQLGVGPTQDGRNGGGDKYFTDGDLVVGMLKKLSVD